MTTSNNKIESISHNTIDTIPTLFQYVELDLDFESSPSPSWILENVALLIRFDSFAWIFDNKLNKKMKQIKKSNTANYNLLPQPRMLRSEQKLRARISLEADPVEFKAKKVGRSYDFPTNQIHF
jgi:hypothetical protein